MQRNFENLGGTAFKEKIVNGVPLKWNEPYKMFQYPMPANAELQLLYDEEKGIFLPVNPKADILSREREATTPEGFRIREKIIYREPKDITPLTLEEQRRLVTARRLQWQAETLETLIQFRPLLVIGILACAVAFFWSLAQAMSGAATMVAAQASLALAEAAYWATWALVCFVVVLALRFGVPLLFRSYGTSTQTELYAACDTATKNGSQGGDVIINVQQGTGTFGSQSEAQKIVNTRTF